MRRMRRLPKLTLRALRRVLRVYDDDVLTNGGHQPEDCQYCALECVSVARETKGDKGNFKRKNLRRFTDHPESVGMPDIRDLNDATWSSDKARTEAMLPMMAALSDWGRWSKERQRLWVLFVLAEIMIHFGKAPKKRFRVDIVDLPFELQKFYDDFDGKAPEAVWRMNDVITAVQVRRFDPFRANERICTHFNKISECKNYKVVRGKRVVDDTELVTLCKIMTRCVRSAAAYAV